MLCGLGVSVLPVALLFQDTQQIDKRVLFFCSLSLAQGGSLLCSASSPWPAREAPSSAALVSFRLPRPGPPVACPGPALT